MHLQEIFFLKFIYVNIRNPIVKIRRGTLVYSKVVKYVKIPLDIPKNKNKKAGKQQSVDNSAVKTAPIIDKDSFFILSLEINMYMKMLLNYNNPMYLHQFQHKDNLTYLMDIELVLDLKQNLLHY